jgi:hypothetical protein
MKSYIGCDLEDFDLEIARLGQNDYLASSGLVFVNIAKGSGTTDVCVTVISNSDVIRKTTITNAETVLGMTSDCFRRLSDLQCKCLWGDAVQILQGENKIVSTVICLTGNLGFPFQQSEATENVLFRVQNHSQNVSETVTSARKFLCFETIATAPPQKRILLSTELCEDLRNVRNDPRIDRRNGQLLQSGWEWTRRLILEWSDSG